MNLHLLFKPDYSPKEMFKLGIFENNYFDESLGLPKITKLKFSKKALDMLQKLPKGLLSNSEGTKEDNYYKVSCGSSYKAWKDNGWIHDQDPYGWVNWYIHYYYGRRTDDDARHLGMLKMYLNSNKIKQSLLHWGIKS